MNRIARYFSRLAYATFALGVLGIASLPLVMSNAVIERALAQAGLQIGPNAIIVGQLFKQGSPPTCTNCTVTARSSDFMGQVTATANTTDVVITFNTAWTSAPKCVVNAEGISSVGLQYAVTTTAITVTGGTAGGKGFSASSKINYVCVG